VGEIVDAYLEYKDGRIADIGRLRLAWDRAKRHFGHLRPEQITYEVSEAYIEARRALGRGDGTILKEINTVRQALNWRKVNVAQFDAPAQPPPRNRHLSKAEYKRLLKHTIQPHVRLFVILAITTAARKTAILELTWDRVDFARNQIVLTIEDERAPNRKRRAVIHMNNTCRKVLDAAYKVRQTDHVIEYAGKAVGNIKKGFALAAERAGLVNVTPHDLRHTAAVWMAESGRPIEEIAQYLGHSDSRITYRVYARYSPEYLKGAASALEIDLDDDPENDA
jgi:integrase